MLSSKDIAATLRQRLLTKRVTRLEDPAKAKPLFYARSPEKIKFSKKGEEKYEEIPRAEFAMRHKFIWADSMFASPELRAMVWKDKKHPKCAFSKVEERLHNPLDSLVVFEKDPAEIGLGVRLADDAKSLPAGTVIGCMAGELISALPYNASYYSVDLTIDEHKASIITDKVSDLSGMSDRIRNICSIINDAPEPHEIDSMHVKSSNSYDKNDVASANAVIVPTVYKGTPMCFIMCSREIMPGEELFWSFGTGFWNFSHVKRYAFNSQGIAIGYFNGKNEIILNSGDKKSVKKPAPRYDLREVKQAYDAVLNSSDTFDAGKRFVADVRYSLIVYEQRFEQGSPEWLYINKIRAQFDEDKNVARRFNNLHAIISDEACAKLLSDLKSELIGHMTKYQATKPKPMLGQKIVGESTMTKKADGIKFSVGSP